MRIQWTDPDHQFTGERNFKSLKTFWRRNVAAEIEFIDGKPYFNYCEICLTPIFIGDQYYQWQGEDAICTCINCGGAGPDHKLTTAEE